MFSNTEHIRTLSEERVYRKKDRDTAYKTKLKGLVRNLKVTYKRLILPAKITGAWIIVRGTIVSVTVLSAMEFWYLLCARYNVSPLNLHSHFDGCGTAFLVTHTLIFIIGGLVIARHNKIHDEILYLS